MLSDDLAHAPKRAIALRRHLSPQREALARLQGEKHEMLDAIDSVHFRELADETARYVEELDSVRERASVVQDEVLNRLTERQNRNSYVLTIVAAIERRDADEAERAARLHIQQAQRTRF